ncbi:MAG: T9SS type A sorting domain-containing protein [Bacteroidota bacterium]
MNKILIRFCLLLSILTFSLKSVAQLKDGAIDTAFNYGYSSRYATWNPVPGISVWGQYDKVSKIAFDQRGNLFVAGAFTAFNGRTQNTMVKLFPDGGLDTTFTTKNITGSPATFLLQGNGKVIIAGPLNTIPASADFGTFRLLPNGKKDPAYRSSKALKGALVATHSGLATQAGPGNKIIAVGSFDRYNGINRNNIVRLDSNGVVDTTFNQGNTGPNQQVYGVYALPNGKLIIYGTFTTYNGSPAKGICRLNADGTLDASFTGPAFTTASSVYQLDRTPSGNFYLYGYIALDANGGAYTLAQIDSTGAISPGFSPISPIQLINTIAAKADGGCWIGGNFRKAGTFNRTFVCEINANGSIPSPNSATVLCDTIVRSIAIAPDGRPVVAGNFNYYRGIRQSALVKIRTDYRADPFFNNGGGANDRVYKAIPLATGKTLICGRFTAWGGRPVKGIARLNANGTLDTTFTPPVTYNIFDDVTDMAVQSTGKIIYCGGFYGPNSTTALNTMARLNTNGLVDNTFNPGGSGPNSHVYKVAVTADDKIWITGVFTRYNTTAGKSIFRLTADGLPDAGFTPSAAGFTKAGNIAGAYGGLAVNSGGQAVVLGNFDTYGTTAVNQLAVIRVTGSLVSLQTGTGFTFSGGNTPEVNALALQPDGKILVGGYFDRYNGTTANSIVRISPASGVADNTFSRPQGGAVGGGRTKTICVQKNGQILLGGSYYPISLNDPEDYIIRVSSTGVKDTNFVQPVKPTNGVGYFTSIANDAQGRVIAGCTEISLSGYYRSGVARLNSQDTCTAPVFTIAPSGGSVCSGDTVRFPYTFSGGGPFTYLWKKGTTPISTAPNFVIPSVTLADAGTYNLTVTGKCGAVTSAFFNLGVKLVPEILTTVPNQSHCAGSLQIVSVNSNTSVTYTWFKNGAIYPDFTGNVLTFNSFSAADTGRYFAVAGNSCGTDTGNTFRISLNPATVITVQPEGPASICLGQTLRMRVVASGAGRLTYRWIKAPNTLLSTLDSLVIPAITANRAGTYTVTVTGTCGDVTSLPVSIDVVPFPRITADLSDQVICTGAAFSTFITANGATSYTWYKNGIAIPVFSNTLSIAGISESDSGNYYVITSNACGADTSRIMHITVNERVNITSRLEFSYTFCEGQHIRFIASAVGTGPLSYEWYRDGSLISSNDTLSTYIFPWDSGSYWVEVTGLCGTVRSFPSRIHVNELTQLYEEPGTQMLCIDKPARIHINAGGTNINYQWFKGDTALGSSGPDYDFASVSPSDAGNYRVMVSGACGGLEYPFEVVVNNPSTYSFTDFLTGPFYQFGNRQLTQAGIYTDTLLNSAGCDSIVTLTLRLPIGNKPFLSGKQVSVYPNPAAGYVHLAYLPAGGSLVKLYSSDGRLIGSQNLKGEKVRFDLSGTVPGLYILEIYTDKYIQREKLRIE